MVNVPELRKQLEFITFNRQAWDQGTWIDVPVEVKSLEEADLWNCGTTGCLAGWTAIANGWRPTSSVAYTVKKDNAVDGVANVAARILGLTPSQAGLLFHGGLSLETLWYVAEVITDGEIMCPLEVAKITKDEKESRIEYIRKILDGAWW